MIAMEVLTLMRIYNQTTADEPRVQFRLLIVQYTPFSTFIF